MARLAVFVVFVVSCFFTIQAFIKVRDVPQNKYAWAEPCVPGKFSPGPDCSQCFCNARRKLICGPPGVCKLSLGLPKKAVIVRLLSREKLSSLPVAADKGSKCEPGVSYRVDCNRCLCLEQKSLMCETRLCSSSTNDISSLKANKLTGKLRHDGSIQAKENCIPSSNTKEKRPVKLLAKRKRRCIPGKRYRIKDSSKLCTCSKNGMISCPVLKLMKLEKNSSKECTPGVVYKSDCKKCICTKDNVLKCTPTECREGSSSEVEVTEAVQVIQLLESEETCTPGVMYQRACNTCICNEDRILDCTQDICAQD